MVWFTRHLTHPAGDWNDDLRAASLTSGAKANKARVGRAERHLPAIHSPAISKDYKNKRIQF